VASKVAVEWPWLVHANGRHYQMQSAALAPLLALYTSRAEELLEYPVLLLEGAHAVCEVTTLRTLMNRTAV
jgi:hypothetical protein